MRSVIQRVQEAKVVVDGKTTGAIAQGLLVLVAYEASDVQKDIDWMIKKISAMRIFNDAQGKMNLSLQDVDGELLIVSQFTLHASTKKGNRPSFINSAKPEQAMLLYEESLIQFQTACNKKIQTGIFGADMKVSLLNDGPVTIILDSKLKE